VEFISFISRYELARLATMAVYGDYLRSIPDFPYYSSDTFGYPERSLRNGEESIIIFGPPLYLYEYTPLKSCTVHVSGIPDWAKMADVVKVFEAFGQLFTIELAVTFASPARVWNQNPVPNGCALVTYVTYDGAQKALDAHLTLLIPGKSFTYSCLNGSIHFKLDLLYLFLGIH